MNFRRSWEGLIVSSGAHDDHGDQRISVRPMRRASLASVTPQGYVILLFPRAGSPGDGSFMVA